MKRIYPHPFFAREGWPFIGAALLIALGVHVFQRLHHGDKQGNKLVGVKQTVTAYVLL